MIIFSFILCSPPAWSNINLMTIKVGCKKMHLIEKVVTLCFSSGKYIFPYLSHHSFNVIQLLWGPSVLESFQIYIWYNLWPLFFYACKDNQYEALRMVYNPTKGNFIQVLLLLLFFTNTTFKKYRKTLHSSSALVSCWQYNV